MKLKDCYIGQLIVYGTNSIGRVDSLTLSSTKEIILGIYFPVDGLREFKMAIHPSNVEPLNKEIQRNDGS